MKDFEGQNHTRRLKAGLTQVEVLVVIGSCWAENKRKGFR